MVKFDAVFRVYGDNILECEHFIDWLLHPEAKLRFEGTEGAIDRPLLSFIDLYSNKRMGFQICPYYGGTGKTTLWSNNPLNDVFDEKVDVLITRVNSNLTESRPLIAIEFVDALMAGNQGWQRFRRATNAAKAQIAYFYVQPLIGWERDAEGLKLKNPRFLPAQTCLAQLSLCSKFGFPSLQIYTKSAWSEYAEKRGYPLPAGYEKFKGVDSAVKIVTSLLRLNIEKKSLEAILKQAYTDILSEMFAVAKTYSRYCNSSLPIHSNHQALKNPELSARIYAEALVNRSPVKGNIGLHTIDEKDFEQSGALFYKDAQKKTSSNNFNNNILSMLNWKSSMEITQCQRYLNCWGISPRGYCSTQKFKNYQ